jgi:hypothetical protein
MFACWLRGIPENQESVLKGDDFLPCAIYSSMDSRVMMIAVTSRRGHSSYQASCMGTSCCSLNSSSVTNLRVILKWILHSILTVSESEQRCTYESARNNIMVTSKKIAQDKGRNPWETWKVSLDTSGFVHGHLDHQMCIHTVTGIETHTHTVTHTQSHTHIYPQSHTQWQLHTYNHTVSHTYS